MRNETIQVDKEWYIYILEKAKSYEVLQQKWVECAMIRDVLREIKGEPSHPAITKI